VETTTAVTNKPRCRVRCD